MGQFGTGEIIMFLVIVLIIFGPKKLPQLAKAIGQSVRELKNGFHGLTEDLKAAANERPAATGPSIPPAPTHVPPAGQVERGAEEKTDQV